LPLKHSAPPRFHQKIGTLLAFLPNFSRSEIKN